MYIPSDISLYIVSLLDNVYDQYNWAATTKQVYESVQSWRVKYWMLGDTLLKSVCVSLTNYINNNDGDIHIKLSDESILIGVNACRTCNYVIITPAKNINKWLQMFIKLKMYNESITSKVILATKLNLTHMNYVTGNDHSNQIILTNPTSFRVIHKYITLTNYIIDAKQFYPNHYTKLISFASDGFIKIIKGFRPIYNVTLTPTILKYDVNIDLYQYGNKILCIGLGDTVAYENTTEAEFNKAEKSIINAENVFSDIFPDVVVSLGYNPPDYARSYTNAPIPYYILCKTDLKLFELNFTLRHYYQRVHLLWMIINLMHIDVTKLTHEDYEFLIYYNCQRQHYESWTSDTSAFTREQVDMFSAKSF